MPDDDAAELECARCGRACVALEDDLCGWCHDDARDGCRFVNGQNDGCRCILARGHREQSHLCPGDALHARHRFDGTPR